MSEEDIEKTLSRYSISWRTADDMCKEQFCNAMKNRQYGLDALTSAWEWFHVGWSGLD